MSDVPDRPDGPGDEDPFEGLPPEHQRSLWGVQEYYRVLSLVNGGRARETDLFEGLR